MTELDLWNEAISAFKENNKELFAENLAIIITNRGLKEREEFFEMLYLALKGIEE